MASPLNNKLNSVIMTVVLAFSLKLVVPIIFAQTTKNIRVEIIRDAESLSLKINSDYKITDSSGNKVLGEGKNLNTTVTVYQGNILMGNDSFIADRIKIKANDTEVFIINGRTFRGEMLLIKNGRGKISVINNIELEDYVKGISIREISHYWPVEALKAEVIVFRTFALYRMKENREDDFDVTSDIYSQVYGGKDAERYRINNAVDQTRGLILTYRGGILPAFYHATCAGHTEDAALLWNIDSPVLKGVVCKFCKESPHFNWHYVGSIDEFLGKLSSNGYPIDAIKEIVILGKDASGRVTDLKISSTKETLKISAKDFRNIIGPNIIRSTNFSVNVVGNDIVLEGFGWGHGVGLCQWGAYFMAKQGFKFEDILKFYYPGAQLSQWN